MKMRSTVLSFIIICTVPISCKHRGVELSSGDGKKRLAENLWIARTSASEYVVIDGHGEGILYGELLAGEKLTDKTFGFIYKEFNSGEKIGVILNGNGSKVGSIMDTKGMIEAGKFYESINY